MMKKHVVSLMGLFIAAAAGLAACVGYYGGGRGYGTYNGYYDNFYGPVPYGYWGGDGYYYYSRVINGPYVRDDAHHFRRDAARGWRHFHMRGHPPG